MVVVVRVLAKALERTPVECWGFGGFVSEESGFGVGSRFGSAGGEEFLQWSGA